MIALRLLAVLAALFAIYAPVVALAAMGPS